MGEVGRVCVSVSLLPLAVTRWVYNMFVNGRVRGRGVSPCLRGGPRSTIWADEVGPGREGPPRDRMSVCMCVCAGWRADSACLSGVCEESLQVEVRQVRCSGVCEQWGRDTTPGATQIGGP